MAGNQFLLAEAFAELDAEDSKLKAKLAGAKNLVVDFDHTLQAASKTASMFLLGAGGAIAYFVKGAADAQEMLSMFNTVFAENAEDVEDWAKAFSDSTGRAKISLMEFAANFQDTFVPLGFAREEAARLSEEMTELAIDLGSFKNIRPEEAVERLTGALIGNHENVRKFGVIINESTLKAELAAMGMTKLTGKALEQAKVMARMNIIMRDTADAQGDAARTSGSAANQILKMQEELKEARIELGNKFMPVAMEFIGVVSELLDKFNSLTDGQKQMITDSVVLAAKIALAIVAVGTLASGLSKLTKAFHLLGVAMKRHPLFLIAGGLATAVSIVSYFTSETEGFVKATEDLADAHDDAAEAAENHKESEDELAKSMLKTKSATDEARESLQKFLDERERQKHSEAKKKDPLIDAKAAQEQGTKAIAKIEKDLDKLVERRQAKLDILEDPLEIQNELKAAEAKVARLRKEGADDMEIGFAETLVDVQKARREVYKTTKAEANEIDKEIATQRKAARDIADLQKKATKEAVEVQAKADEEAAQKKAKEEAAAKIAALEEQKEMIRKGAKDKGLRDAIGVRTVGAAGLQSALQSFQEDTERKAREKKQEKLAEERNKKLEAINEQIKALRETERAAVLT